MALQRVQYAARFGLGRNKIGGRAGGSIPHRRADARF
jgi:hypothetical protein